MGSSKINFPTVGHSTHMKTCNWECFSWHRVNSPAPIMPGPMTLVGISIPNLHFSASNIRSKLPVPNRGSLPRIKHSLTPRKWSTSAWEAASMSTSTYNTTHPGYLEILLLHSDLLYILSRSKRLFSKINSSFFPIAVPHMSRKRFSCGSLLTVSSNEHLISAPTSCRLIPCLVMAIRWPRQVMMSQSRAKWR